MNTTIFEIADSAVRIDSSMTRAQLIETLVREAGAVPDISSLSETLDPTNLLLRLAQHRVVYMRLETLFSFQHRTEIKSKFIDRVNTNLFPFNIVMAVGANSAMFVKDASIWPAR